MKSSIYLLPHHSQPLFQTHALIGLILDQHSLSPQPHARLAILPHDIKMRHDDAADPARSVITALFNDCPDPLVEIVLEHGEGLFADFDLGSIGDGKDVFDKLGDGVFAKP